MACRSRSERSSLQRSKVSGDQGRGPPPASRAGPGWGTATGTPAGPLRTSRRQLRVVVGEVEERAGGAELLPLEQHRRARRQQQQRGQRPEAAGARQLVAALAAGGVGDLVVVLEEVDERRRRQVERRGAAALLLPRVPLPLVEKAVLDARDQLLRRAEVVGVVGLVAAGQRHQRRVVEVVVPERVEAVAALRGRAHQLRLLRLVLGDDRSSARPRPRAPRRTIAARMWSVEASKISGWRRAAGRRGGTRRSSSRRWRRRTRAPAARPRRRS